MARKKSENSGKGWPEGIVTIDDKVKHCTAIMHGYPEGHQQIPKITVFIERLKGKSSD